MYPTVKQLLKKGDVDGLRMKLARYPDRATRRPVWGLPPCKTEALHYLSDGYFMGLWHHGREGELARTLIAAGAPVDGLPDSGETPLHGAASLGCVAVAVALLENGADTERCAVYPGIPHGTPLDFAVHFGMTGVVDVLVHHGARICSGRMAAGAGRLDLLADWLNAPDTIPDIVRCACVCDRREVVDFFLDRGFEIDTLIDGASLLHWAVWESKLAMVRHLIHHGADPILRDTQHGLTPAGWARHRLKGRGSHRNFEEILAFLEANTKA